MTYKQVLDTLKNIFATFCRDHFLTLPFGLSNAPELFHRTDLSKVYINKLNKKSHFRSFKPYFLAFVFLFEEQGPLYTPAYRSGGIPWSSNPATVNSKPSATEVTRVQTETTV